MTHKLRVRWRRILTIMAVAFMMVFNMHYWHGAAAQSENDLVAQEVSAVWEKGSFPVENFQSYTSGFGYRISPVTGKRQFHNGLDLAAPRGSYIRSWWGGEVSELSDNTACGTSVTIKSGEWQHVYCHLEGYVADADGDQALMDKGGGIQLVMGQSIPAGARIGRIGMTGRTTGPHLHWVLKHNGGYVDPALVLKEMFKHQTVSSAS